MMNILYLPASRMQIGDMNVSAIPQMIIRRFWSRKSSADLTYVHAFEFRRKTKRLACWHNFPDP